MTRGPAPTATGDFHTVPSHAEWMPLARDACERLVETFGGLSAHDWSRPTPCDGWSVRDLAGHVVGSMRAAASLRETMSQQRAVKRRAIETGEQEVDAMTAIQLERAADLDHQQVVDELRSLVEPALRGRARPPGFVRRRAGFHVTMGSIDERWNLDYFLGCILTRDSWLHRIDLCDALGHEADLDHNDRRIVGDVAMEWVRRHGRPAELILTGPAGGRLSAGEDGDEITIDAIEFCRVVSGRSAHPHPLLGQEVPF
jgi:uncharacterized protein (TIGR03083 family)